jgi:hypothetical protein
MKTGFLLVKHGIVFFGVFYRKCSITRPCFAVIQVDAASPMPPTKRPMKIYLSLPRPASRLANGGWLLDGHMAVDGYRGPALPANRTTAAPSSYAIRHRARCDTPVMRTSANMSRSGWPPPLPPSSQHVVTRRDQNSQTVDGGTVVTPPSRMACERALPPGGLLAPGGGSLPNISKTRRVQQNYDFLV